MFRRGHVELVLTMANLKLKPFLFTPHPSVYGGGGMTGGIICNTLSLTKDL